MTARSLKVPWRAVASIALALILVGAFYLTRTTRSAPQATQVVVATRATTRYGEILVSRRGFTLYTYHLDPKDHSTCVAFCLQMWPPLTVPAGRRPTGTGVSGLGTIVTPDGARQVTYDGRPLYLYVLDHVPGRVSGVGNDWSVVTVTPG